MAARSRRFSQKKPPRNESRLPRNATPIAVTITHIGGRGDGVGKARYTHNYHDAEHHVFVPASLPGEDIIVQPLSISKQGIKARILNIGHRQTLNYGNVISSPTNLNAPMSLPVPSARH